MNWRGGSSAGAGGVSLGRPSWGGIGGVCSHFGLAHIWGLGIWILGRLNGNFD